MVHVRRGVVEGPVGAVSYLEWPSDTAADPLLCLHPVNTSAEIWSDVAAGLGRRVIAVDYRGHGHSDPGLPVFPGNFAEDARAVADALGLGRLHLAGGSIGGAVAVEFIATDPARVATLSLFGATLRIGLTDEHLDPMVTALRDLGVREWFVRHGADILGSRARPDSAQRLIEMASAGRDVATVEANLVTTFSQADARRTARLLTDAGTIPPASVVVGAQDPTCPPAMAVEMAAMLGTTAEVIDDIGHLPMLEAPDDVIGVLRRTLVDES